MQVSSSAARPIPRCPPPFPFFYAALLDKMSSPALKAELGKQQMRLFAAEHGKRPDPMVARDARTKIALCEKEIASRQANPMAEYAKQAHRMSDKELRSEISTQQGRLWVSQHGFRYDPVTERDAMAKLKILSAEASSRGIKVPPSSPFGPR
jgi:hypothetical protein